MARMFGVMFLLWISLVILPAKESDKKRKDHVSALERAFTLHQQGKFPDAIKSYKIAIKGLESQIESKPDPAAVKRLTTALHNIGFLLTYELKKPQKALAYFQRATRLDPSYFEVYHHLGAALTSESRHREAIEQYEFEAKIKPRLVDPLIQMAKAYNSLGQSSTAANIMLKAVDVEPASTAAFNGAGWLLTLEGRVAEAVKVLKRGRKLHPSDPHIPLHLGKAYTDLGQPSKAVAAIRKAVQFDPSNSEASLLLGMALFDKADSGFSTGSGVWAECGASLQAALDKGLTGTNSLIAINHLSHALWQQGRLAEGLGAAAAGLRAAPDFADLHVRRLQLQALVCNYTGWADGAAAVARLVARQVADGKPPTANPFTMLALDLADLPTRLHWYTRYSGGGGVVVCGGYG